MRRMSASCALALAVLAGAPARAADAVAPMAAPPASSWLERPLMEDLRLGLYVHDPMSPEKGGADVNAELVFAPFPAGSGPLAFLVPRVHAGATLSFGARTSIGYAGFLWRLPITDALFLEASLGGAIHNGRDGGAPGRNAMGCAGGFHESLSLGYRFAPQWSVLATVEHVSNAGLCDQNRGLTNAGLRLSRSF